MGAFDYTTIYFSIAAFFMDVLLCYFTLTKYYADNQSRRFRTLVFIVTAANVLENIRPCLAPLPNTAVNVLLKKIVQSACYVGSTGIAFAFSRYLDSFIQSGTRVRHVFRRINYAVYALYVAVLAANVLTEWVAGFDIVTNRWTYGPVYRTVGYGVPIYFLLFCLAFFFRDIRRMDRKVRFAMLSSILTSVLMLILQPYLHGKVHLSPFGISISIYLWYFAVENYDYRTLMEVIEKLKEAEHRAQVANQAKGAFLANMSHEIRTPMNAVLGMDEMILRTDDKAEIDEYARNIQSAGKTLLAIINDILDFSKIESGKMQIVEAPYHLAALLEDVGHMIGMKATQKELRFEVDVDTSLPDELHGDEVRVRQVIINVLNNAVKYTERGTVSFRVRGDVSSDSTLVLLQLTISDTGIGIRPEDMGTLFNSFERVEEAKTHSVEGTGLGLSIVYHLVKLMGGTITVQSEYGKGSTFSIELPQKVVGGGIISDFKLQGVQKDTFLTEHMIAPRAKFLVVDDSTVNLIVARGLLKYTEAQIVTCTGGAECLELMQKEKYDIIFLDHMMPGIDGVEVLRRSRTLEGNLNKDTPIIALTANAMAGMREKYLEMGFTDYLSKPINSGLLYELVFRVISPLLIEPARKEPGASPEPAGGTPPAAAVSPAPAAPEAGRAQEPPGAGEPAEDAPLFSAEAGLSLCGNDKAMFRQLLGVFREEKAGTQAKLMRFLISEEWNDYTVLVHAVKSSALLAGSRPLSELAKKLELAGKDILAGTEARERAELIQENHGALIRMYDEVDALVAAYLAQ